MAKKKKKGSGKVGASIKTEDDFKKAKIADSGKFLEEQEDNSCCLKRKCDPCTIEDPCWKQFKIFEIKELRKMFFGSQISKRNRRAALVRELSSLRKVVTFFVSFFFF